MHGWGWKLGLYKDHIRLVCNSRGSGVEINLCLQSYNFGNCTSNRTVRSLWGKVPSPALRIQICWCSRCLRVNAAGLIPVPNTSKKKKKLEEHFRHRQLSSNSEVPTQPIQPFPRHRSPWVIQCQLWGTGEPSCVPSLEKHFEYLRSAKYLVKERYPLIS